MELLTEFEVEQKVQQVLQRIRPYLIEDGGDVEFVRYEANTRVLEVRLTGNCTDCPLAMMTLRAGIERVLIKEIPQIKRIEKVR